MKRKITLIALGLIAVALTIMLVFYFGIGLTVKSNIKHCQEIYPGSSEDALIAYMLDEDKHPENRSHVAIWTLAQLESEKALPHLYKLYKDDPKGKTCTDKHDEELCQYEIHKAIKSIENGRLISYERFKN